MGWQDRLRELGKGLAGVTADVLQDVAGDSLVKANLNPENPDTATEEEDTQNTAPGGNTPDTPEGEPMPDTPAVQDPKTLFWDPFAIIEQLGFKERPSSITYGTLKAMVYRMPIVQALIQTRIQQVAAFCKVSRDRYDLGFKIATREALHEPTPAERQWIRQAETMITRTGITDNPRGRDSFEKFVRKYMWDSLVYDQGVFEVVPDRRGRPCEFYAVDGSTFRLADSASTYLNEDDKTAVRFVQIYDGMIISEYNQEELCFGIRNPRTDIRSFGYGVSELEMALVVITALLFGWEYNVKAFSQGSAAKGILNFKGAIPERQLQAFRRHWYQMISGVENCLAGDVTIDTPESNCQISEFLGGALERKTQIWDGANWQKAIVYKTKESKQLIFTTLGNGTRLGTSPDHKFEVIGDKEIPVWKVQSELKIGDMVLVNSQKVNRQIPVGIDMPFNYGLEPVIKIEVTDKFVPMFDVQVYHKDHRFMANGVSTHNSWRTPITNAEDLQWLPMQNTNRDMEYSAWFDFLIKIVSALYTIDPVEINFKYGNAGQRGAMTEASNQEKVTESKERGLRPLLRFLESNINQWIIRPINENFEFKFVGMDSHTRDQTADLNMKLVKSVRTIDELRAEDDLPALPDGKGEIILDPTWLQFSQAKDQAAQGGMGQPGMGGQEQGQPDFEQLLSQYGGPLPGQGEENPEQPGAQGQPFQKSLTAGKSKRRVKVRVTI